MDKKREHATTSREWELLQTHKQPRLKLEDVRKWAQATQEGNTQESTQAIEEAYTEAKGFITHIVQKATKPGLSWKEMMSPGIEGFVTALHRFDYKSPNARLGFIGSYIRNYVLREASLHMTQLNLPYSAYSRDNRIAALANQLEIAGIEPTNTAISQASISPQYSRAGYGRKRTDGTEREPVLITEEQVQDWRVRSERKFSDSDLLSENIPGGQSMRSDLMTTAIELAHKHCSHPEAVIEHFERGKLTNKELADYGISRNSHNEDIAILIGELKRNFDDLNTYQIIFDEYVPRSKRTIES